MGTQGDKSLLDVSRNVIACKLGYVHGGLCLSRNEKKAVFSFCSSLAIYNRWVTQRKELNKERVVTWYCPSSWAQPSHLAKASTASTVEVLIGSTPRCRCCPASSSNGVWWVAEWTLLLYTNSASGSQSAQSSCQWLTKTQRYTSISWLMHSVWPSVCGW